MQKRKLVCGNWKLNHSLADTLTWIQNAKSELQKYPSVEMAIAPVITTLFAACEQAKSSNLKIVAQNVGFVEEGACTGEWSVKHLLELGCNMAIVGHSERRQYFGETDEAVTQKVELCLEHGITPIICVGESLQERAQGQVQQVISRQMRGWLSLLGNYQTELVVAYEPVWAIGTGKTPKEHDIKQVHAWIFEALVSVCGIEKASWMRIIYGGSVKPENASKISEIPHVDGFLVGGASLLVESFFEIVKAIGPKT